MVKAGGLFRVHYRKPTPDLCEVWLSVPTGTSLGVVECLLSQAETEDGAVRLALSLVEALTYEFNERRLLIQPAPDLPLG